MHIGIDASRMAVAARTGTEHYTYELLGAIARLDRRSRYTLYCNGAPAALPPLGPNFALRRIPLPRLWTHARLSAEVALRRPDVLFIPAHVVPLGAPLRKIRTVVTIHDLGYLRFPEAHTRAQRLYLRLSTVWSARAATRIIAISGATRDDLARLAGVPSSKITVVHHGVSPRFQRTTDRRPPTTDERSTAPGRQSSADLHPPSLILHPSSYFLYVGTIQPRKNLLRLIEAYAMLGARGLGLGTTSFRDASDAPLEAVPRGPGPQPLIPSLYIAGKRGWLTEAIERRAAELGVADRVRFLGYVPDAELPDLLAGALAFVFPSLYEGFGMPVLEAMAAGTPVLTSNTTSLPEVAGDAALLVDPEDTAAIAAGLARLATDAALRAELQARGLARAAHFTWERCACETLAVLRGEGEGAAPGAPP